MHVNARIKTEKFDKLYSTLLGFVRAATRKYARVRTGKSEFINSEWPSSSQESYVQLFRQHPMGLVPRSGSNSSSILTSRHNLFAME